MDLFRWLNANAFRTSHHPYAEVMLDLCEREGIVVGETPWNFADFGTIQSPMRAGGNRKGLFTRDRKPKLAAHYFKARWENFKK